MKQICALMFGLSALLLAESPSAQTNYPEKPIRLVVGFPPGSQPDTVARLLGQKLTEAFGKSIVVDNAAGAAGNIAADRVAKAAPDGYTLGLLSQVQLAIIVVVLPLTREGKLRALAVTSLRRSSAAPELPTIAESGYPGFEVTVWQGLLAPARTPAAIIRKLHLETVKALALPDLRAKFADLGLETIGNSPAEFAAAIKSEIPKWAKVIKDAGIKAE